MYAVDLALISQVRSFEEVESGLKITGAVNSLRRYYEENSLQSKHTISISLRSHEARRTLHIYGKVFI